MHGTKRSKQGAFSGEYWSDRKQFWSFSFLRYVSCWHLWSLSQAFWIPDLNEVEKWVSDSNNIHHNINNNDNKNNHNNDDNDKNNACWRLWGYRGPSLPTNHFVTRTSIEILNEYFFSLEVEKESHRIMNEQFRLTATWGMYTYENIQRRFLSWWYYLKYSMNKFLVNCRVLSHQLYLIFLLNNNSTGAKNLSWNSKTYSPLPRY